MRNQVDRSQFLSSLITSMSNTLAALRGLVPLIGLALVAVGLILLVINVVSPSTPLEIAGLVLQGIGVITAIIGLLLIEPLGK